MRIIHKLLLGFLWVILLIWIIGYFAVYTGQKALQKSIEDNSISLAIEIFDQIDRNIYYKVELFQLYAKDPALQREVLASNQEFEKLDNIQAYIDRQDKAWTSVPKEKVTAFMQQLIDRKLSEELRKKLTFYEKKYGYKVIGEVFVTNKYGANVAQTGKTTDYRQDDEEWWQKAKQDGSYVSEVEHDASSDIYSTAIGIRINDENGNFIGVMKVVLNVEEIENIIKQAKAHIRYKTADLKFINKDGRLIYSTEEFKFFEDLSDDFPLIFKDKEKHNGYFMANSDRPAEGKELFVYVHSRGYRDFKGLGCVLVLRLNAKEIFASVIRLRNGLLVVLSAVTILAILLGVIVSCGISKPIGKLRKIAMEIGRGNFDIPIGIKRSDEIGELAASFKKMTEDLKRTTTSIVNLNKEIAERKRIEEVLRESENRYRLLADNVTDVIFTTDLNLRFTYVSPSIIGMLGYSAEEVVSKRLEEFLAPSSVEVAKKAFAEEMGIENNQGKGFFRSRVLELEIISKDGSSKWAEVKTTFLRDSNERPVSILGICRDLTERMEAEAALIQTNERLQYLLSSTSAVIYTSKISGDYGVIYITGNVRQITGYEPREFTENSSFWIEHVHPEDRPRILEELPRIFEQGFHIYEYRFLHKNGTHRWMRNEMRLERDKEGKPLEIVGIWIDITERKLTEEKIRHAAEEWRTTFDSITDMVSIHDRNFKIIRVNKAYANFLKKRPQEVIGMTCYELFHGSKERHPYCPHVQAIQTKKPTTAEFFDSYTGVYLEIFCSPIFDEKGEVIATVHTARDITLRKEMEKTQRLTQLGKLVADMAHEVNNPLMVISGRAQLSLMEDIKNEAIKNNLKIIFEECQRARDIIQRLLSFSRPSKGELKEININRSIETVVGVVEHQFKLAGTEIKRNYMEKPPAIVADEKQIQEVVMNLLNNAKDAMPKSGVIEIVTSYENDFLRIDFKDTGSGISEGDIKRMFEPFFTTKKNGTGLGLSLCYGIVKAYGGDIKIESKLGKGTVVTVLLPVKEALDNA